ncbi:MAG: hypothetical protein FWE19_02115 [Oscillospiraceae bacterium]|nr:hypothetical protein [Oscillospiraceae bacterium]
MSDYKQMYFAMFNAVSNAIEILQKAQQAGEDAYIEDACKELMPPDAEHAD